MIFHAETTSLPVAKERARHTIARCPLRYTGTDINHFTGSIR
jgi:hypothetical protein